jgi:hypothetical protein
LPPPPQSVQRSLLPQLVRGTNNLSITRVDMFYSAIEGWLSSVADVLNRYGLPRIWEMNGLNPDLMPQILPDMPQRLHPKAYARPAFVI